MNDKEKILMISERVPFPSDNGGKLRTANIIKQLSKKYNIELVVYSQDFVSKTQKEEVNKYCKKVYLFEEGYPSKLKHLQFFLKGKSGISCGIYSENMKNCIDNLLESTTYRMIWVERLFCMPYLDEYFSKKIRSIPVVLNMHDVDSEAVKYFSKVEINKVKRLYYKFEYKKVLELEQQSFDRANVVIACSQRDKEVYFNLFKCEENKWIVANNGVDLEIAKGFKPVERDVNQILFVGGLDNPCNREGIIWFITSVWDKLLKSNPDVKLFIAGSGKSTEEIVKLTNKHKNIKYLGYVDDVNNLYLKSGCIIVPLHSGSGTRLKIVEAFSFGLPVVSTTIGAEGLPVENNKHLFITDTADEFVRALKRIITDKEIRTSIPIMAYEIAKKYYDWDTIIQKTVSDIEAII